MLAAYLVLILLSAYAWVSVGACHRGETCPRAATWSVGMVGISLLGVADSLNLTSPLERLMNPVPLIDLQYVTGRHGVRLGDRTPVQVDAARLDRSPR